MKGSSGILMLFATVVLSFSAINGSASTGKEKIAPWPTRENNEPEASVRNQRPGNRIEIWRKKYNSKAARAAGESNCLDGMEIIFDTLRTELAKVRPRNGKGAENPSNQDLCNVEIGNAKTVAAWRVLFDIIFSRIPRKHPLAYSENRRAVVAIMESATDAIYKGIAVTLSHRSSKIRSELEVLEKTAACRFTKLALGTHFVIRKGKEYPPGTEAGLILAKKNTVSNALMFTRVTFGGIYFLLDAISCEAQAESVNNPRPSMTVLFKKAAASCKGWNKAVFDAIELLFPPHSEKQ